MKKLIIFDWGRTLFDNDANALFPETVPLLQYLSTKYTLAIVSLAPDGDFERRWEAIRRHGLEPYFALIAFTATDKDACYESMMEDIGVMATDTIIVDDRVIRGISWGNRRGATTIWFQNGKFAQELPDETTGAPTHVIHALAELYEIL